MIIKVIRLGILSTLQKPPFCTGFDQDTEHAREYVLEQKALIFLEFPKSLTPDFQVCKLGEQKEITESLAKRESPIQIGRAIFASY